MITHVFNSSVVSGPEMLVIPALKKLGVKTSIVFLCETRLSEASKRPVEYAKQFGHEVYTVDVNGRWDRHAFRKLRSVLDQISPAIVHAHDVKASTYVLKAKKVAPGFVPSIVSTHHGAAYRKGKIRLYEEFYVRLILPHFDRIACVCEADRKSLIARGIRAERLYIHLNGADRSYIPEASRNEVSETIRRTWKQKNPQVPEPSDALFLGAVARLSPEKRHDRMIGFLRELKRQGHQKRVVLLCFGEGAEQDRLKQLAEKLGVQNDVLWMGYSKTIAEEMAGLDLILSVSDGEGIPVSLIEAGWAGTPALVTRVGGIPDLVSSEQFGYIVEPKDSVAQMTVQLKSALENPAQLRKVGAAFQKRVSTRFSESAWLTRLNEIYQGLESREWVSVG